MDISENIAKETTIEDVAIAPPGPPNTDIQHTQPEEPYGMSEGEASFDEDEDKDKDEDEDEEMDDWGWNARNLEGRNNKESTSHSSDDQSSDEDDGTLLQEEPLNDRKFLISPQREYGSRFAVIKDDIQNSVLGNGEDLSGIFHFQQLPSAPNPLLTIEGLGSVGVPVGARDAAAISGLATSSLGNQLRTSGTNIRTIEASHVSFGNPQWTKTIHKNITQTVWKGLGIAPYLAPVQCLLQKVVMIEPGSISIRDLSTDDDKMFAYVVVQLPSPHMGGQARVTQRTHTQKINLAEQPLATSVLAFFKGAHLSFDPITEGYRVALVYGLATVTNPDLPVEASVAVKLQRVFRKWIDKQYRRTAPSRKQLVYILDQQQRRLSRKQRRQARFAVPEFTPRDNDIISCLRPVAQEFEYIVFAGTLSHHFNDNDDETDIEFMDIVGSDGVAIDGAGVNIDIKNIVPRNFFTSTPPDDDEYSHDTESTDYWYSRKALLIIPKKSESAVLAHANETYWLYRLEEVEPNGTERLDSQAISKVLSQIRRTSSGYGPNWEAGRRLLNLALKWKNLKLWSEAARSLSFSLDAHNIEDIMDAWSLFSCERFINTQVQSKKRLDTVQRVASHALPQVQEAVTNWATERYTETLILMRPPELHNIEEILMIGRERGATFLNKILIPHLLDHVPSIEFIEQLVQQLLQNTGTIPDCIPPLADTSEAKVTAEMLAAKCFWMSLRQPLSMTFGIFSTRPISLQDQPKVFSRIQTIIRLYLRSEKIDLNQCALPLRMLLNTNPSDYKKVRPIYHRILEELKAKLEDYEIPITSPPFKDFFAAVIGLHLQSLLESPPPSGQVDLETFGCGCGYCRRIDHFLRTREQSRFHERLMAPEKRHLQGFIDDLQTRGIVQYEVGPEPYGAESKIFLTLSDKHLGLLPTNAWDDRAKSAKEYLCSIGSDDEIAALMGADYPKIQTALEGKSAYKVSKRFIAALGEVTMERLRTPMQQRRPVANQAPAAVLKDSPNTPKPVLEETQKRKVEGDAHAEQPSKRAREE